MTNNQKPVLPDTSEKKVKFEDVQGVRDIVYPLSRQVILPAGGRSQRRTQRNRRIFKISREIFASWRQTSQRHQRLNRDIVSFFLDFFLLQASFSLVRQAREKRCSRAPSPAKRASHFSSARDPNSTRCSSASERRESETYLVRKLLKEIITVPPDLMCVKIRLRITLPALYLSTNWTQ